MAKSNRENNKTRGPVRRSSRGRDSSKDATVMAGLMLFGSAVAAAVNSTSTAAVSMICWIYPQ